MNIKRIDLTNFKGYRDFFFTTEEFYQINFKNRFVDFSYEYVDESDVTKAILLLSQDNQNMKNLKSYLGFSFGGIITKERGVKLDELICELLNCLKENGYGSIEITFPQQFITIPDFQKFHWKKNTKRSEILYEEAFSVLPLDYKMVSKSKSLLNLMKAISIGTILMI